MCSILTLFLVKVYEQMKRCDRYKLLCMTIPFGVLGSCTLLLCGIFVGPIWLTAIAVAIAMGTVLILGYLFNGSRIHRPTSPSNGRTRSNTMFDIEGIPPPYCICALKLPTYEEALAEIQNTNSQFQQQQQQIQQLGLDQQQQQLQLDHEQQPQQQQQQQQQHVGYYFETHTCILGIPPPSYKESSPLSMP